MKTSVCVLALCAMVGGLACAQAGQLDNPKSSEAQCYRQALSLIAPDTASQWILMKATENGGVSADYVAGYRGDIARISWYVGAGRQPMENCTVEKSNSRGRVVFRREGTVRAFDDNPRFF